MFGAEDCEAESQVGGFLRDLVLYRSTVWHSSTRQSKARAGNTPSTAPCSLFSFCECAWTLCPVVLELIYPFSSAVTGLGVDIECALP